MKVIVKSFDELTTKELYEIYRLRSEVFVVEQNCPYQDIDDRDFESYHVSFYDKNELVAYLRVLPITAERSDVMLGRVISRYRRRGLGTALVRKGIEVAVEKYKVHRIYIEAQAYARDFYEESGFRVVSAPFLEDDIWHIGMLWEDKH